MAKDQNDYGQQPVVPGVYIVPEDAVYITDDQGEIVTWNSAEVADDPSAFTAALHAVVLATAKGPAAVRQNLAEKGAVLTRLYDQTNGLNPFAERYDEFQDALNACIEAMQGVVGGHIGKLDPLAMEALRDSAHTKKVRVLQLFNAALNTWQTGRL